MTLRPPPSPLVRPSVSFGGRKPHSPPPEAVARSVESKNAGCGHRGHLFRKSHSPSLTLERERCLPSLSLVIRPSASCGGNTGNQREAHCSCRLKKRAAHFVPTDEWENAPRSLVPRSVCLPFHFILSSTKGVGLPHAKATVVHLQDK